MTDFAVSVPSREQLIHLLYEAAELEHNLMCTYLYAAFSLRTGEDEGLSSEEAAVVEGWRRTLLEISVEEMGHLTAVWNITAALGGAPRFGRDNFPLDPGALPAGIVVKLAPFSAATLQHFVHLERPEASDEAEGSGFESEVAFHRGQHSLRLTPMGVDYDTVGTFYACLGRGLRAFVAQHGEDAAFCGDPALQLSTAEVALRSAQPVICSKTALRAFAAIVEQGEGAALQSEGSHFQRFAQVRKELNTLASKNPAFSASFPAATNPVLRPPMRPQGRVWLETPEAIATVDLANTCYSLMLRMLAYSYTVPRPETGKALVIDLGLGLMRAMTALGEHAARLPAGPSNPECNAGMSFTALRDAAPLPRGESARHFFLERLTEMAAAAQQLDKTGQGRPASAARWLAELLQRAKRGFAAAEVESTTAGAAPPPKASSTAPDNPETTIEDGVERVEGKDATLMFEAKRCIHARFCVTGAPTVFLANVKGPWLHPDTVSVEHLTEIAHSCPSGAIRYSRKDGKANETPAQVNLLSIREAGPYAVRGDLRIDGVAGNLRATLCRCGASKNKPFCDGSHHDVNFSASGEPPSGNTDMLPVRDGPLSIDPQADGPLTVRGNLEITSGTGRVVARLQQARLCRCGGSANKPFCDGTHTRIGFRSS